ncbi:MAG: hypothetical protein LBK99_02295, partial [Opitutaceae bacterium]|nr:hypothetical protein [Opitutaceae bacterium]
LTVIAIIGILAAIIIPTIGKVRQTAQAARCVSVMHSLYMGFAAFANDNKQHYMLPYNNSSGIDQKWFCHVAPYLNYEIKGNWTDLENALTRSNSPLKCPVSDRARLQSEGWAYGWISFAMPQLHRNAYTGTLPIPGSAPGVAVTDIKNPASSLLVVETHAEAVFRDWRKGNEAGVVQGMDYPHNNKCNALFADGHVKAVSGMDAQANWPVWYDKCVGD